mmetsp:Transcript_52066/g.85601  ORF Transcript_52066/g.85601 Transcript_52066/m.85601 type:complete len:82 (-) Transcript_52066:250-495(-)
MVQKPTSPQLQTTIPADLPRNARGLFRTTPALRVTACGLHKKRGTRVLVPHSLCTVCVEKKYAAPMSLIADLEGPAKGDRG